MPLKKSKTRTPLASALTLHHGKTFAALILGELDLAYFPTCFAAGRLTEKPKKRLILLGDLRLKRVKEIEP